MFKSSGFKHGWPKPVDLLFQVLMSPKTLDDDNNEKTLLSDASPKSLSSLPCATEPIIQEPTYPGDKLRSHDSIRLLKIHINDRQKSRISCSLQSFDLGLEESHYRALSYTWSPAIRETTPTNESSTVDEKQEILCNGQPFLVTQNLHDVLLEFGLSGFTDYLWVDAICINQSNIEERAHQVSMMDRIYSTANETVVWLGKDESGLGDVQWGIEVMIPKMLQWDQYQLDSLPLTDPQLEKFFGVEDLKCRLIGITNFFASRQWFHRAWVIQEVALAAMVSVHAGKWQVSWTDLTNLSIILARVLWETRLMANLPDLVRSYLVAKAFLGSLPYLRALIPLPREVGIYAAQQTPVRRETTKLLQANHGARTELQMAAAWMMQTLLMVRNMESSERRDKIYSILGIVNYFSPKIGELIVPDYNEPVAKVYTSLTAAVLLNSRYLSILAHLGDISNQQCADLPSWVVDYSSTNHTNPIMAFGGSHPAHVDASLSCKSPPFPRRIDEMKLTLTGADFDHIAMVSPATLDQVLENASHFENFMKFVSRLPNAYFNGQSRTEVLWRTMMWDSEETGDRTNYPAPGFFANRFQAWLINMIGLWVADVVENGIEINSANESARQFFAQLYPGTQIEVPEEYQQSEEAFTRYHRTQARRFVHFSLDKVRDRKLFKTTSDLLGLGSCSIQPNDQVWLIRDSRTPLILRPKPGTQDFQLVGEAYLQGFMHGEMLDGRWKLEERIGPVTII